MARDGRLSAAEERRVRGPLSPQLPRARTTASGSRSITVSSTRAARSGTRRPCSHSCTARTSSPKVSANFWRLSFIRLRSARMCSAAGSSTMRQVSDCAAVPHFVQDHPEQSALIPPCIRPPDEVGGTRRTEPGGGEPHRSPGSNPCITLVQPGQMVATRGPFPMVCWDCDGVDGEIPRRESRDDGSNHESGCG